MNDTHEVLYGLVGYPLSHSFSSYYFAEKFKRENIKNACYKNFELPSIEGILPILSIENLRGLNITIPYKQAIIPYATHLSEEVREMKASNCLHKKKDALIAYNTDILGIEKTILSLEPIQNMRKRRALVLGTGGASLAVQYVLKKYAIPYFIVSREKKNDSTLLYQELSKEILSAHTFIINATPIGTYPNVNLSPPIPYEYISPRHILFDLVYNPPLSAFLSKGKQMGAYTVNGRKMLEWQAESSWEIWNAMD